MDDPRYEVAAYPQLSVGGAQVTPPAIVGA